MYSGRLSGLNEDFKTRIEILKEGAIQDVLGSIWEKLGTKLDKLRSSATPSPTRAAGIPVQVQLPTVQQLLPQAVLVFGVLMIPALVGAFNPSRRRASRRRR